MTHLDKERSQGLVAQTFEGLLGSIGVILSSNASVAVLAFATLALSSRALGPEGLGLLVLIEAYGRIFDQVVRLEPTQAIIRMGMRHQDEPSAAPFRRLVRFGFVLDAGGSVVATVVALACLPLAGAWFGFDDGTLRLVALYCLTFLVPAPATANALLRLFGRFGRYGLVSVLAALARLVVTVGLFLAGSGFEAFVLLLIAGTCLERLAPTLVCWPLLRRKAGRGVLREPLRGLRAENPGLWPFIMTCNLNVIARSSTRRFDVAALGGFLSPAEIGFYVLARRLAMLILRMASPIQLAIYPRMCELVARNAMAQFLRLVRVFLLAFVALAACALATFAVIGQPLVVLAFGAEFVPAVPHALAQLAGACLLLMGTVFNSALQAIGRSGQLMAVSILSAAVFFVPLPFVLPLYGPIAASYLVLVSGAVVPLGCGLIFLGAMRRAPVGPASTD